MKRGSKRKPLEHKITAGTDRHDRTNYDEPQIAAPAVKPGWLKRHKEASRLWDHYEQIGFVSRTLRSWDAENFAEYLVQRALFRKELSKKDGFIANQTIAELRKQAELWGLHGSASRTRIKENKKPNGQTQSTGAQKDSPKGAKTTQTDGQEEATGSPATVTDISDYL